MVKLAASDVADALVAVRRRAGLNSPVGEALAPDLQRRLIDCGEPVYRLAGEYAAALGTHDLEVAKQILRGVLHHCARMRDRNNHSLSKCVAAVQLWGNVPLTVCEASRAIAGQTFRLNEAPDLPLDGCDRIECPCSYRPLFNWELPT